MVTILPTKTNLGSALGQSLGQGLQTGIENQVQRGITQQDLNRLRQKSQSASPTDLAFNIAEATALNPALARAAGPLFETLMKSQQTNRFFGGQGVGNGLTGQPINTNIKPGYGTVNEPTPTVNIVNQGKGIPTTFEGQGEPVAGQPRPSGYTSSGVLPSIMPAEEIDARAREAAFLENDPSSLPKWQQYYSNLNDLSRIARSEAETALLNSGLDQTEIPEAMKIGEKFSSEKDLNKWTIDTKRTYDEYKNNKEKLNNALIPGFFTGLTQGPEKREAAIKRLSGSVQDLVKSGHEPYVRQILANQDLSPTEIEEVIHPLSRQTIKNIENFPKGIFERNEVDFKSANPTKKQNDFVDYETALEKAPKEMAAMQNRLSSFFKNNVNDDTSLLVLRHKLWNEKNYDWRQIGPAIREAMSKGLKLTPAQLSELTEIETQPPRQSVSDIFSDWGRWYDKLKGKK